MQRVYELIENIKNQLSREYQDTTEAHQYAWWLLESLTGLEKINLIEQQSLTLTAQQQKQLQEWLHQLVEEHMPLQYLLGSVPFNGVEILIKPPILIPRPETEEWTINLCNQLKHLNNNKITILDLCTGSGCIAIALAKSFPEASIYATDISDEAIACTKENIKLNKLTNVHVIKSDLFENIQSSLKFDLIVGNPPYIDPEDWQSLEPSVSKWEDKHALIAPDHGLAIIKQIIQQASVFLKPNNDLQELNIPQLILEIDIDQGHRVKEFMITSGYCDTTVHKDLEGKDRTISARVLPCGYLNR